MSSIFLASLLASAAPVAAAQRIGVDPLTIRVDDSAAHRFAEVWKASGGKPTAEQQSVEQMFPAIAQWVRGGHIEIGDQEGFGFVVRALDYGGLAFEDDKPDTLAEALAALEKGLTKWFKEQGIEVEGSR